MLKGVQVKQAKLIYFSPTGNVARTLRKIAAGTGLEVTEYDLTPPAARWQKYAFTAEDLVFIGMPVYYGRIPAIAAEFFRGIRAENTPAVFVVSFGNRNYDDALAELKQCCEENGFIGVAAAAFVGEHAASPEIALGRPDAPDDEKAFLFGRDIKRKIEGAADIDQVKDLQVKGRFPDGQGTNQSVYPSTNDFCTGCGLCARECPVSAINPADPKEVDGLRCITCFRCIRNCPKGAKYIANDKFNKLVAKLVQICADRKEPEIFI